MTWRLFFFPTYSTIFQLSSVTRKEHLLSLWKLLRYHPPFSLFSSSFFLFHVCAAGGTRDNTHLCITIVQHENTIHKKSHLHSLEEPEFPVVCQIDSLGIVAPPPPSINIYLSHLTRASPCHDVTFRRFGPSAVHPLHAGICFFSSIDG